MMMCHPCDNPHLCHFIFSSILELFDKKTQVLGLKKINKLNGGLT